MADRVYEARLCDDEVRVFVIHGSSPRCLRVRVVVEKADSGVPRSTLFYAGKTFAPSLMVNTRTGLPSHVSPPSAPYQDDEEQNIQDFLQDRYMGMFERLVDALQGVDGVLGFEVC